jgi:iron complex outermembrane receptor protein
MPAKGDVMRTWLPAAGVFFLACGPALAAPITDDTVITVRGGAESGFSTPAAVTVLDADAIAARGITTLDAAVIAAPGLHMINDQDPGTNIVSLRGVSTDRLQQAAIAYLADGVALADTEFFTGRLYDVAQIEVLKGPQGAVLGKSAAGGALQIVTRDPSSQLRYVTLGAGDGAWRSGEGALSIRLGGGWRARAAGAWSAADGWIHNATLDHIVDAEESRNLRLRLSGPLGPVALQFKVQWMEDDGGAAWASSNNVTGLALGMLDGAVLTDPIGDFEGRSARRWLQTSARATAPLAGGEVTGVLARDRYRKRWVEELDYRPGPVTVFGVLAFPQGLQPIAQPTDITVQTGEVRWARVFDPGEGAVAWQMTFGAFLQDIDRRRVDDFGPLLFGAPAPAYDTKSLQSAIFAGVAAASQRWTGEFQIRTDQDDRAQTITAAGAEVDRRDVSFKKIQPRVAIGFTPTEDLYFYGVYGEGFRTGGFNPLPGASSIWKARFEPEVTRSLEVGVKARGAGWRADANVFESRIEKYQSYTFLDGQSVTLSIDAVRVSGIEVSGQTALVLSQASDIVLSAGYASARGVIDRFIAPDPLTAGRLRDYSGARTPNAPDWTATASARLAHRIADVELTLQADVNATGETYFELDNVLRAPAKSWIDLRAGVARSGWSAALWGRNVTDERWAISAFGQGMLPLLAGLGPNGPFDTFTLNRGRQWGGEITRRF